MKKQRIYDLVKTLLEENADLRDSDKKLIWRVWSELELTEGISKYGEDYDKYISEESFMKAPSTETIRRCRQSIQEHNTALRGSKWIQKARAEKAKEKGTFIYREEIREQGSLI